MVKRGWATRGKADSASLKAIDYGLSRARALARLGVGQTVIVKKNAVAAVEAMEGTDETIRRAGRWAGAGTIAVKVAGPRQDWRFDVPTVGLKTIRSLAQAKARGIVVEAGRCFLLGGEKTVETADKEGIFMLAV